MFKIGAGISYYGSMHPAHAKARRGILDDVPCLEISGCPYPEMARAEVTRQALEHSCECVVFIDPDVSFDPRDVRRLAEKALEAGTIVSATVETPKSGPTRQYLSGSPRLVEKHLHARPWTPEHFFDMSFTAVPLKVLEALASRIDLAHYTNSSVIDTGFSKNSRAFFSPWRRNKGTLFTEPLEAPIYCNPDRAFLIRAQSLGFPTLFDPTIAVRSLSGSSYSVRISNADARGAERRRNHSIETNYAVCVPCFGAVDNEQQAALWELEKAGVVIVELHGCPYIDLVRSELTRIALEELQCDGVFFLDHDIIFTPQDALSLTREAEERQDVIAAVYNMRKTAHSLIGAIDVPPGTLVPFFEIGETLPALYSGLGFAAIPRAVIEKLKSAFPALDGGFPGDVYPLYALDINGDFYSGEDVSFCARVQGLSVSGSPGEKGQGTPNGIEWNVERAKNGSTSHRVWLNTKIRIFHKGSYHYGIEDHSLAVPRYAQLQANLCASREEARQFFRTVDQLKADVHIKSQGLEENSAAPHGVLQ